MDKKKTIFLLFGVIFSAIGFYLAFHNVPLSALGHYAKQINYWWTFPAAISLVVSYIIRSLRWQWLLLPAGRVKLSTAYHSLIISMMINCLLPGRVGELARPMVLKNQANLPIASSLAALGVERLLDLLALLLLLLPTLMVLTPEASTTVKFGDYQLSRTLLIDLGYMAFVTVAFLILAILFLGHDLLRSFFLKGLLRSPDILERINLTRLSGLLHRAVPVLAGFIERSAQGVKYICSVKGFLVATVTSVIFWSFNALSFYFLAVGSPDVGLPFTSICGVMVVICFFIALPSVPGFWGLWEAAGVFALSLYGVANDVAAGFSLFSHAFNIIPVIVAGWLSSMALGFRWTGLAKETPSDDIRG